MKKDEFLNELRRRLDGLSPGDIEERVSFYSEMIDDRMEEGLSEEEAVKGIGSVDSVVGQIMSEIPLSRLVKDRVKAREKHGAGFVILLILGFPIWFPLAVTALSLIFSFFVTIWSVIVAFFATDLALAGAAVIGLIAGVASLFSSNAAGAVFCVGAAFICAGLSVLFFVFSVWVAKGTVFLSGRIVLGLKTAFIAKEAK